MVHRRPNGTLANTAGRGMFGSWTSVLNWLYHIYTSYLMVQKACLDILVDLSGGARMPQRAKRSAETGQGPRILSCLLSYNKHRLGFSLEDVC